MISFLKGSELGSSPYEFNMALS